MIPVRASLVEILAKAEQIPATRIIEDSLKCSKKLAT
jgi:hypothetical protein